MKRSILQGADFITVLAGFFISFEVPPFLLFFFIHINNFYFSLIDFF